jgi:predicted enzyme related to lactoylglutathione lyase
MLKLSSIMLGSSDPKSLSAFYSKVLEKEPDMVDGDWYGYSIGECFLTMGSHDKVKGKATNPERVMFNFETKEVKAEFDRITKLGATVVAEPYQMDSSWIATLCDPDGNYFQLMSPWQ